MAKSIFLKSEHSSQKIKKMNLNFGPQHPAAHGVLRMILQLNGEIIENSDCHIGLLHRGTEKLIENKMYIHSIPYFDRLDYVSMLIQEHSYCLSIEKLMNRESHNSNTNKLRVIFDELTRILNHLLALACHALDVGSMSPIFWGFEEREKIMEFYERISGARMHAAYYRPVTTNLTPISSFLLEDIILFVKNHYIILNEITSLLTYNKIWKQRLVGIGCITSSNCTDFGLTGVLARSTGLLTDLRLDKLNCYSYYPNLVFNSFIGVNGDCYDRYLIRINEMVESLSVVNNVINNLLKFNNYNICDSKFESLTNPYKNMENLITHFKYWSEGFVINSNEVLGGVESPKGEFYTYLQSDNTNKPFRCKIKSPAYYSLQFLPKLVKGHLLADLITLIGTIDIVFGEVDR